MCPDRSPSRSPPRHRLVHVVNDDDVGMADTGETANLGQDRRSKWPVQPDDLERHITPKPRVPRLIDFAECATADSWTACETGRRVGDWRRGPDRNPLKRRDGRQHPQRFEHAAVVRG